MSRIGQSHLAKLFSRLATSYSAGIDIRTILKKESSLGGSQHQLVMRNLAQGVDQGLTLADAMRKNDNYFPELAVSVIHAGERGGRLEDSFGRLAEHYNNLVTFRNRLLTALAWPMFELAFAVLMVGGLMALCDYVFKLLEKKPINWFLMGSTLGNVIAYFVLVGLVLFGIFLLIRGTKRGWFGDVPIKIARRIPVVGSTIEALSLSRFAWTMGVAENAGMNPVEIAQLSLASTENYYYKQHEDKVTRMLRDGKSFYKTFKSTQAFPDEFLSFVDNGEISGQLAESMDRCSVDFQNRADLNLKLLGTIGFVMMLGFVAIMVLIIVVFAMSQYVNLLNDFSQPGAFR